MPPPHHPPAPPTDLIGVEDVATPSWKAGSRSVVDASSLAMVTTVPRVLAGAFRDGWAAAPWLTVAAVALRLAAGAVTAFGLLSTANVFTELLTAGPTPQRLVAALPSIALVALAYAVRGLLDTAAGLVQAVLAPRIERRAQDALYTAVMGVDLIAFDDPDFTDLVARASSQGLSALRTNTGVGGELLASLVSVGAAMVTAAVLNPLLAPVVLLSVVPQAWATVRAAKIQYRSFLETSSRSRRLSVTAGLITSRTDAAEIRAVTAQEVLLGEHRRIADQLTAEAVRVQRRTATVRLTGRALAGIGGGLAYLILGALIYGQVVPLALAGAAALALRTAAGSVSSLVQSSNRLYESSFYLDLYRQALRDAAARTRTAGTRTAAVTAAEVPSPRTIEFDDVSFTYPGQSSPAVAHVSLTLHAGQTLALVGENGSGKSTLAKLLCGLYLPGGGTVRWDGVDIATHDPRALHDRIALVLQDPAEWPMTAENNVRIGRIEAADPDGARLAAATTRSGADTVLAELPRGPETMLSRHFQTGRDLSGGQWQRISVARGLYRGSPVVVADEPTAAMDARAEQQVFDHLHDIGSDPDRITVLVTHRLANVRHADHIAVLDHGRLAEHGTHRELVALGGVYAELFALQAANYVDAAE